MKISVIVPYWNSEKWIGECCESLTNQQGDFEFLMVDDHSTDRGKDIVLKYAHDDDRFRMFDNLRGKGVSGARNTGLDYATGDYITFLDADDELVGDAYEAFVKTIEDDVKANVHQLNHLRYYPTIDKTAFKYANGKGRYDCKNLPLIWFGVWNKLFRDEFVKDIRFDERLQYGEDGLFILECFAKGAYIHHGEYRVVAVTHRFINKGSLSKVKDAKGLIRQVHAYEEFMMRQENPDLKIMVCEELARLWGGDTFKRCFGHGL